MKDLKKVKGNLSRAREAAPRPAPAVRLHHIEDHEAGQRIDNFLLRELKGVPRSHVYRLLRAGEVRVNSARVDATCRLQTGDAVRIPPVRTAAPKVASAPRRDPGFPVVFEDDALLVIDKPAGVAVHGGSGVSFGVIEQLRAARPALRFLELVHRLDKETSGLLMLAKKRSALTQLHAAMRANEVRKVYFAMVKGAWTAPARNVSLALRKYLTPEGERRVSVDREGMASRTRFELVQRAGSYTLLRAILETGRTHQIRVHLAHLGFPILGDDKYGDYELNRRLTKGGLKRMFLHAGELRLTHPLNGTPLRLEAPLPPDLAAFLAAHANEHAATL
jgi:23S rRNA pseudouridine955/2504/2580 synthase